MAGIVLIISGGRHSGIGDEDEGGGAVAGIPEAMPGTHKASGP